MTEKVLEMPNLSSWKSMPSPFLYKATLLIELVSRICKVDWTVNQYWTSTIYERR